jgi:opacity protein-like surface antigen
VSSDLTYQIYGGIGYRFKEWFSAELGYRVLDVDYDDDGFVYDLTMHGPMAGFRFQF